MMRPTLRTEEDGVAMITALLAVVILTGLALVFMNRATTESRASANSRDHEAAIHVSEGAADRQVREVNADNDYVTLDRDGSPIEISLSAVTDDEAWARNLLSVIGPDENGDTADAWTTLEEGESFAVRPYDLDADEPLNVVYSVGAVPAFDAPNAKVRVIKLQIAQDSYIPEFALLSAGPLGFGGNASIVVPGCDTTTAQTALDTCHADVHTNSNFTNPGNASTIQGQVSQVVGSCPSGVTALNGCIDANAGVTQKPIPEFSARDFYNRGDDLNPDPEGQTVEWFDLCPPGKPIAGQATIRRPGTQPCMASSPQVWPSPENDGNSYRGWRWQANEWRGGAIGAGVFYVYHADAKVTGTSGALQRAVSILVEQDPAMPSGSGALDVSGNPRVQSALQSVLFIADTDLDLQGTLSADDCNPLASEAVQKQRMSGFVGVGEQLKVMGNVSLHGSIIVRDVADVHNLVKRNNDGVQGNMCLEYDDNLDVDFLGIWVITYWNEL